MARVQNGVETTDRLLAAATEVFAEVGYRAATLREICQRARANIAAVNYHFGDKEQLYAVVLDRAVAEAGDGLALLRPDPGDPPERKLRHFIRQFLQNILGEDRPVHLLRLMSHEMVEPTPTLTLVIDKAIRPLNALLDAIVAELLGPAVGPRVIRDCAVSVLAQCSSYHQSQAVIQRLEQLAVHDPATIEHLADHIFRFSLGGIQALAASLPSAGEAGEQPASCTSNVT